ncbi:TetR/AcrR family transcriptional regulator C-terminal domain-containing protein [Sulfitobacter sp. F26204]|nr:TetR/AcrR family transcriptional regulator C-terminal domain-containing protein [Sulfitobacter sp. F26204]
MAVDQLTVLLAPRRMVIGDVERFPGLSNFLYLNGPKRAMDRLASAGGHYIGTGALDTPDTQQATTQFNWIAMSAANQCCDAAR